jgi:2-hydroxy-3-oxopropionate reductase
MRIVLDEAHRLNVPALTSAVAAQLFNAVVGSGKGEEDSIAVLQILEVMSGANPEA